jgi:hypothetical protein
MALVFERTGKEWLGMRDDFFIKAGGTASIVAGGEIRIVKIGIP